MNVGERVTTPGEQPKDVLTHREARYALVNTWLSECRKLNPYDWKGGLRYKAERIDQLMEEQLDNHEISVSYKSNGKKRE